MQDYQGTTFIHYLSDSDTERALETGGFNYTVSLETASAGEANAYWKDPRAVENKQAEASGWVTPNELDCRVQMQEFCLNSASKVSDGRWSFDFTIRAEANSQCGNLSTTLDLIGEGNYLGSVSIDNNEIIDAFNCDCVKTFSVEADYDGSAGDVYGQLFVRNSAHQIALISDSCVLSLPQ